MKNVTTKMTIKKETIASFNTEKMNKPKNNLFTFTGVF